MHYCNVIINWKTNILFSTTAIQSFQRESFKLIKNNFIFIRLMKSQEKDKFFGIFLGYNIIIKKKVLQMVKAWIEIYYIDQSLTSCFPKSTWSEDLMGNPRLLKKCLIIFNLNSLKRQRGFESLNELVTVQPPGAREESNSS